MDSWRVLHKTILEPSRNCLYTKKNKCINFADKSQEDDINILLTDFKLNFFKVKPPRISIDDSEQILRIKITFSNWIINAKEPNRIKSFGIFNFTFFSEY